MEVSGMRSCCTVWLALVALFLRASACCDTHYVDPPYDTEGVRCLIDHTVLRGGSNANVLAVEVHNHTEGDDDLRFDLKLGYFKNNWRSQ